MHDLVDIFPGLPCKTRVWVCTKAHDASRDYAQKETHREATLRNLLRYAQNGFDNYIGRHLPIRRYKNGVYRIRATSSRFRMYGFFENNARDSFLIFDAFVKRKQKLSRAEWGRIDRVAALRMETGQAWVKEQ